MGLCAGLVSVTAFSFHPASRVSILKSRNPLQMALDRSHVTEMTDEEADSPHVFLGVANRPGYKRREFRYAYRRVVDVKVGRRRLTDSD